MAWDTKGRLWVAVLAQLPGAHADPKIGDSIIILEDTDKDGRADNARTTSTI